MKKWVILVVCCLLAIGSCVMFSFFQVRSANDKRAENEKLISDLQTALSEYQNEDDTESVAGLDYDVSMVSQGENAIDMFLRGLSDFADYRQMRQDVMCAVGLRESDRFVELLLPDDLGGNTIRFDVIEAEFQGVSDGNYVYSTNVEWHVVFEDGDIGYFSGLFIFEVNENANVCGVKAGLRK